ncbi:LysE family translocator [Vibrio vulnificus]|uniref:LysE family translocator n=1 Tax=Vibrio parahaemolyticus TaxID=670 RepID=UPI0004A2812D|nr:LysE family translocator [Vibrio parahaemolyticus]EGR7975705.1 LysE family translocator [Vibrio vulnificus]KIT28471.1 lysine transporter LysE [Vibrio parahaemolyticus VP766]EGR2774383.1 LysE family translocator [Vibrio parahaemolyticus]EGR2836867.1 LysE family translocator [Vibrio parahaemolyticus]EGR2890229.1 LysE family translocator [Vibrio parahaemolyticus]
MVSLEFLITSFVVVVIPGTGVLFTVATGLFNSKKASLFAAIGCTFGIVPSLLASVFGLAAIFHTSALAFQIVKYCGSAYLLYLAWTMWRASSPLSLDKNQAKSSFKDIAIRGFLINILNPKLSMFFLAFLPQFVSPQAEQPLASMFVLGSVFMLMTFSIFVVYGALASTFSDYIVRSEKASLVIQKVFAGGFAAMGLKLALTERA